MSRRKTRRTAIDRGLLRQLDAAAILAADEAVNVNVAVIDVAKDIPAALTCGRIADRIGQSRSTTDPRRAPAFEPRTYSSIPNTPYRLSSGVGRLQHIESPADAAVPGRWLVGFDEPA